MANILESTCVSLGMIFLLKNWYSIYNNEPQSLWEHSSPRHMGSCVFCAPLDRYIDRHIDRHIGRLSVDTSTNARPTLGRYIDRDVSADILTDISTKISANISTNTRPICQPRVVRQLANMLINRLPTFRQYLTATCVLVTVAWVADIP